MSRSVPTYLLWFAIGALVPIGAALAIMRLPLNQRPESGRWVFECLEKKREAARLRSFRLVILSGSNALYGFSARRLSEVHGVESVNASVHAGLGLGYILHYGRAFIAPGRVIVMPLEYELYGKPAYEQAFQDQVIGYDPAYFRGLPFWTKLNVSSRISNEKRGSILLAALQRNRAPRPAPPDPRQPSAQTLNDWGDETNNVHGAKPPPQESAHAEFTIAEEAWREIEDFSREAEAAGARVVLAYPNIYYKSLDPVLNRKFLAELGERAARSHLAIVGRVPESLFDETRYYDTRYHQNARGQVLSTDRLYADLVKNKQVFKLLDPLSEN